MKDRTRGLAPAGEDEWIALPNHSVEANRRRAAPPGAGSQFGSPFSAQPCFPAAVAHLWRSAVASTRLPASAISDTLIR